MIIKIMNKLYPGKENYKKRNAIYRKVRKLVNSLCEIIFLFLSYFISFALIVVFLNMILYLIFK